MSSGAEAISAGLGGVETDRSVVATNQHLAFVPERASDGEIHLRSMAVYLPDRPLVINGQPYMVSYDAAKLAAAVGVVDRYQKGFSGNLYPRQLVVSLGKEQSGIELGESGNDVTTSTNTASQAAQPLLSPMKEGTSIQLILPAEVASTDLSAEGVVKHLTQEVNRDLLTALGENLKAKQRFGLGMKMSSLALALAAGEGVGIATAEDGVHMLIRGSIGGAVAALLAAGTSILHQQIELYRRDIRNDDASSYNVLAIMKSRGTVKNPGSSYHFKKIRDDGQIITLRCVEEQTAEQAVGS